MRTAFSSHGFNRIVSAKQPSKTFQPQFAGKVSDEFTARLNEINIEEARKQREFASHILSQTFLEGHSHQKLLQLVEELAEQKAQARKTEYEEKLAAYKKAGFFKRLLEDIRMPQLKTGLTVFDVLEKFHRKEALVVIQALKQLASAKVIQLTSYEHRLPYEDEQKFHSYGLWSIDAYEAARTVTVTPLGKELAEADLKAVLGGTVSVMKPFDPDSNFPEE